jgi:SAM-dependent methyltransferase
MSLERWKRAQESEKKYWLSTKSTASDKSRKQYFEEKITHGFNINYDFFAGKSVLEIGCGPNGIIFQIDNAKSRVGLEPLDLDDLTHEQWKKSIIRNGVGEKIPFESNSFDVILSFNALDHSFSPSKVIEEAHRVLRKDGDLLIWLHVLREKYHFLESLLNRLDSSHPYHLTQNRILEMLNERGFQIKNEKHDDGTGLPNNSLKKIIANCIMSDSWLWSRKIHQ